MRESRPARRDLGGLIAHLVLGTGAVLMVLPFFWQISLSLQTLAESQAIPPKLIPRTPQWQNYSHVFDVLPTFGRMILNTLIVAGAKAIGITAVAVTAGYAFARLHFPGRGLVFSLFLSLMMIPGALFLLPQYEIVIKLGWLNTLTGLIVPGLMQVFSIFLLRQFFMQLPPELDEAARIDGASIGQVFWHVMLPLARPAITTVMILSLLGAWNELMWPLIVNNDPNKYVVSVGLASLKGQYTTDILTTMAASTLATLPVLLVFLVLRRRIISGIALNGGLKG